MAFYSHNPATGERLKEYQLEDFAAISKKLEQGQAAYQEWKAFSVNERQEYVRNFADILEANSDQYARLMTLEMGKAIKESRSEILKCAWLCRVYAENASQWLAQQQVGADGIKHFVSFESLGGILTIMPWNFPFWQVLRFAIPALLVGNVVLLKHSNQVPGCALAIECAFCQAGFPAGVFQTTITSHEMIEKILAHPFIQGASFTGSTEAGRKVYALAAKNLKKMVLELGGSDPFIVLDDANIERAVEGALIGRLINAGQSCIAAKRFIVQKGIYEQFCQLFVQKMQQKITGNPLDEEVDLGPLINQAAVAEIDSQVRDALEQGAQLLCGGEHKDNFYLPTVLGRATASMKVAREEVFGPVAPIFVVENEREAVALANSTSFGLGASVWSENSARAMSVARELECGTVFVNSSVKSDPRMPFGGIKESGIGRELSRYGLLEFANIKAYNIY